MEENHNTLKKTADFLLCLKIAIVYTIQGVQSKFEQLRLNITFFVIARFSKI
jgi:hypothetical protein